jgi:thioredoxin 1
MQILTTGRDDRLSTIRSSKIALLHFTFQLSMPARTVFLLIFILSCPSGINCYVQCPRRPRIIPNRRLTVRSTTTTPSCLVHTTIANGRRRNNDRKQIIVLGSTSKTGGRSITSVEQYNYYVLGESIQSTTTNRRPVLVFWTAPWCGPCRLSIPVVKDVIKQFSTKIDVVEICTDDLPDVASEAGVASIPTIQICYKGKILDTIIGCVAKSVLASAVEKALEDIKLKHGDPVKTDIVNGDVDS